VDDLEIDLEGQEFRGYLILEDSPCEDVQTKKRDRPNRTMLVRVMCIFVLIQIYDLEFDLKGQGISRSSFLEDSLV
jgi:hypothetical protein